MLKSNSLDKINGGVFDAFRREDDQPMWHTNKAWWQQAEAIIALTKAIQIHLFNSSKIENEIILYRDNALKFYFNHFIDFIRGGEYPVVQMDGTPVLSENKGTAGTGSYHQVELARMMKDYTKLQQSQ